MSPELRDVIERIVDDFERPTRTERQALFAKSVGTSGPHLREFLVGTRQLSFPVAKKLYKLYGVDPHLLLK